MSILLAGVVNMIMARVAVGMRMGYGLVLMQMAMDQIMGFQKGQVS